MYDLISLRTQLRGMAKDVFITPGRSKSFNTPNPRAIHNYGDKVARSRFKLVLVKGD